MFVSASLLLKFVISLYFYWWHLRFFQLEPSSLVFLLAWKIISLYVFSVDDLQVSTHEFVWFTIAFWGIDFLVFSINPPQDSSLHPGLGAKFSIFSIPKLNAPNLWAFEVYFCGQTCYNTLHIISECFFKLSSGFHMQYQRSVNEGLLLFLHNGQDEDFSLVLAFFPCKIWSMVFLFSLLW